VTGESVELAYVDQGYTGEDAFDAAAKHGIILEVVKLGDAKRGFVLLPAPLGRGALVRMGGAIPAPGEGLRAALRDARRAALRCVQPTDAPKGGSAVRVEFITRSRSESLQAGKAVIKGQPHVARPSLSHSGEPSKSSPSDEPHKPISHATWSGSLACAGWSVPRTGTRTAVTWRRLAWLSRMA